MGGWGRVGGGREEPRGKEGLHLDEASALSTFPSKPWGLEKKGQQECLVEKQCTCFISRQPGDGHQGTAGLALDLQLPKLPSHFFLLPDSLGPSCHRLRWWGALPGPSSDLAIQKPWPALLPSPALPLQGEPL